MLVQSEARHALHCLSVGPMASAHFCTGAGEQPWISWEVKRRDAFMAESVSVLEANG
jgi:hypothetical protein